MKTVEELVPFIEREMKRAKQAVKDAHPESTAIHNWIGFHQAMGLVLEFLGYFEDEDAIRAAFLTLEDIENEGS